MKDNEKKKLTPRQQKFADYYIELGNATEAYKRAGYKASGNSAEAAAARMLRNVKVKSYIDKRQKDLAQKTGITQERVVEELARIGFAKLTNFVEYRTEKTIVGRDEETGEPIIGYDVLTDVKDSKEVDGSVISEISRGRDGTFKFKLHDKVKALDMIARHLGMYKDKVEHSGEVGIQVAVDYGEDDKGMQE